MINLEGGYLGFTFDGRHSSEFGLLVVSDGSRYHQNASSNFSDTITQVPGYNGGYYFGTQIGMRDFDINCVFDEMTTHTLHEMQRWLYPNKVGWLIFDETPYKKYLVKTSNVIQPSFIPFDGENSQIKSYKFQKEILKGEVNISFFSFDEYGYENEEYELQTISDSEIIKQQTLDCGLLPHDYIHNGILLSNDKVDIEKNNIFTIYNAGNGIANADFHFEIECNAITDNNPLEFFNFDNGENYIIYNPEKILLKKGYNISNFAKYKIDIYGSKKEIWLEGINSNNEKITDSPINIGGCYNHYFPRIYHLKPTEIMIASLLENGEQIEPLFYQYSNEVKRNIPSDGSSQFSFEEIKNLWSDYTMLTGENVVSINAVLNPVFGFLHFDENTTSQYVNNQIVYLIYPNKFMCNKDIFNFIPVYKNTYI